MKTFNDLEFTPHPLDSQGVMSRIMFDNGWGASVVRHEYSYGGKTGKYELAVLDSNGDLHYDNEVANGDVQGYLDEEEVTYLLAAIQEYGRFNQEV
jgi:hypothetical protein